MTKYCGRLFLITVEDPGNPGTYLTVGGMQANSFSINNEQVDVTDKGGMPWRELINCGLRNLSASGNGFVSDDAAADIVEAAALSGDILNYEFISGKGDKYGCACQVSTFERAGDHNNAETFTASFESSQVVTYTAAP